LRNIVSIDQFTKIGKGEACGTCRRGEIRTKFCGETWGKGATC